VRYAAAVAVLLAVALALRLGFVALFSPPAPQFDAAVYDVMARQLLLGEGVHAHGMRALRPPLYPAFLALVYVLFGPRVGAAQLAQVGLSLGTLGLLYVLARSQFGRGAALLALAIGTVHPQLVRYPSLLMSENLYLPLLLGALYLCGLTRTRGTSWRWPWLAAGITLGLAALVRELALLLGLTLTACFLCMGVLRRWRRDMRAEGGGTVTGAATGGRLIVGSLAFAAGLLLAVAPWAARNHAVLGSPVPITTNFGWVLWLGYNPNSTGFYHPFTLPLGVTGELEVAAYFQREALAWIAANPLRAAELTLLRLWLFWRPYFVASPEDGRLGLLFAVAKTAAVLVIFGGAALALWTKWRRPAAGGQALAWTSGLLPVAVLCAVSTIGHAATHMEAGGRYRLPVEVALVPLAGAGWAAALSHASTGSQPGANRNRSRRAHTGA
jgi:4-amino-4-deoxy-L-arabinose transferase-like glycosyltransferase